MKLLLLSVLTGGRLEIGVGKGISAPEQRILGATPNTASRARSRRCLDPIELVFDAPSLAA